MSSVIQFTGLPVQINIPQTIGSITGGITGLINFVGDLLTRQTPVVNAVRNEEIRNETSPSFNVKNGNFYEYLHPPVRFLPQEEIVYHRPAYSNNKQQPDYSNNNQQLDYSSNNHQLDFSSNNHQLDYSSNSQQLAYSTNKDKLPYSNNNHQFEDLNFQSYNSFPYYP